MVAVMLYVPIFVLVFVGVRTSWLHYLSRLSESELHLRVFDHSTSVALSLWALCIVLAGVLAYASAFILVRNSVSNADAPPA
jgi:ABC-type spermidine/putrescine transport system permease subunit I